MTDLEFDVLDELYFVTSFDELKDQADIKESLLKSCLETLYQKGWIKCFKTMAEEELPDLVDIPNKYQEYAYLASKKGLLAHNRR